MKLTDESTLLEDARREAEAIVSAARNEAQRAREIHAEDMANLNLAKEAIEAEIREAEARLDELNAYYDALNEKVAVLDER